MLSTLNIGVSEPGNPKDQLASDWYAGSVNGIENACCEPSKSGIDRCRVNGPDGWAIWSTTTPAVAPAFDVRFARALATAVYMCPV